jgi:hypothetical protein
MRLKVRRDLGKRGRPKRGGGVTWRRRNRQNTAAVEADSDRRFWAAWGLSGRIGRGEMERRERGLNRHRGEPN